MWLGHHGQVIHALMLLQWRSDRHDVLFLWQQTSLSISATCLSVSFWISASRALDHLQMQACPDQLFHSFIGVTAQVPYCNLCVFAFAAYDLGQPLRRSSVIMGMGTLIRSPMLEGFSPRSLSRMAFRSWHPCLFPRLR